MGSMLQDGSSAHHKGLLRGQPSAELGLHVCSMCPAMGVFELELWEEFLQ